MNRIYLLIISLFVALPSQAQDFWEEIPTPLTDIYSFHCINETDMLLGGYSSIIENSGGLYVSSNKGDTWEHQNLLNQNSICWHIGHYNETVLAYVGSHLFKMNDLYDWQNINNSQASGTLLLINDTIIIKRNWGTIEKSVDGGHTWYLVHNVDSNENVEVIIQHPNGDLFFGTYAAVVNAIPGVYRSTDLGETWERAGLNYHMPMALAADSEGVLYAGSWGHYYTAIGGIYKSTDLGVTWDTLKLGLGVRDLVITPGDTIFAGHRNGVSRSVDGGDTWTLINSGFDLPDVYKLTLGGDGHLYAVIDANQSLLFRSKNAVTGIEDKTEGTETKFSLYPNPANDQLYISRQGQQQPASVAIINMQGQILRQHTLQLPGTLAINHLPTGIYMLRLQTGATIYTQQFIKK